MKKYIFNVWYGKQFMEEMDIHANSEEEAFDSAVDEAQNNLRVELEDIELMSD